MALEAFAGNDVTIGVAVKDIAGNKFDLTGVTIESVAKRENLTATGTNTVLSALDGLYKIEFNETQLSVGEWLLQSRVTKGTLTRTVIAETLVIMPGQS